MISDYMIHEVQRLHESKFGEADPVLSVAIGRKVAEEGIELAQAVVEDEPLAIRHEIGDVLFAIIAACRRWDTDPEIALTDAIKRNRERWQVH